MSLSQPLQISPSVFIARGHQNILTCFKNSENQCDLHFGIIDYTNQLIKGISVYYTEKQGSFMAGITQYEDNQMYSGIKAKKKDPLFTFIHHNFQDFSLAIHFFANTFFATEFRVNSLTSALALAAHRLNLLHHAWA